jgi:hypothetical protein
MSDPITIKSRLTAYDRRCLSLSSATFYAPPPLLRVFRDPVHVAIPPGVAGPDLGAVSVAEVAEVVSGPAEAVAVAEVASGPAELVVVPAAGVAEPRASVGIAAAFAA